MTYDYSTVRKKGYSISPIHDHRIQSGFSIFIWTGQIKKLQKLQKKFTKVTYLVMKKLQKFLWWLKLYMSIPTSYFTFFLQIMLISFI